MRPEHGKPSAPQEQSWLRDLERRSREKPVSRRRAIWIRSLRNITFTLIWVVVFLYLAELDGYPENFANIRINGQVRGENLKLFWYSHVLLERRWPLDIFLFCWMWLPVPCSLWSVWQQRRRRRTESLDAKSTP